MARPVGDEHIARPGAAKAGQGCEPDPATPADLADRAEDAARRAVEGRGVAVTPRSPTNWIIADNNMVHVGTRVHLTDGRTGTIIRVAPHSGRPMVRIDDTGAAEPVHPAHIARAVL